MEKEFIPYEQALALKELGFDEENILGYYRGNRIVDLVEYKFTIENYPHIKFIPASLYQQAFRWFREKYDLESSIVFHENYLYQGKTNVYETIIEKRGKNSRYFFTPIEGFITYEEAELECLKKLIELCKKI